MPLCGVVGNTENPEGEIVIQGLLKEKVLLLFLPKSGVGSDEPVSQYGLWSFQVEGTKLERFLHQNQHRIVASTNTSRLVTCLG